jgi:hypothetical protein
MTPTLFLPLPPRPKRAFRCNGVVVARARDGTRSRILGAAKPTRSGIMIELGANASHETIAHTSTTSNNHNFMVCPTVINLGRGEDKDKLEKRFHFVAKILGRFFFQIRKKNLFRGSSGYVRMLLKTRVRGVYKSGVCVMKD